MAERLRLLVRLATLGISVAMALTVLQLLGVVTHFVSVVSDDGSSWGPALGFDSPSMPLSIGYLVLVLATAALVVAALACAYTLAGERGLNLARERRWYVASWFVPVANLFVPYKATAAIWDHATGGLRKSFFRWWWATWVLTAVGPVVRSSHVNAAGDRVLDSSARVYQAATALCLGALTSILLRRLSRAFAPVAPDKAAAST